MNWYSTLNLVRYWMLTLLWCVSHYCVFASELLEITVARKNSWITVYLVLVASRSWTSNCVDISKQSLVLQMIEQLFYLSLHLIISLWKVKCLLLYRKIFHTKQENNKQNFSTKSLLLMIRMLRKRKLLGTMSSIKRYVSKYIVWNNCIECKFVNLNTL